MAVVLQTGPPLQKLVRASTHYLLVTSEDPDSDAGIGQPLNGLRHSRLQLVLDGGAAQQQQLPLYQVPHSCKLLITP